MPAQRQRERPPPSGRPASGGEYRHSQFGTPIAIGSAFGVALGTLVVASVSRATLESAPWLVVALYVAVLAPLALFGRLTVTVDARCVRLVFGVGLLRREVPLSQILRVDVGRARRWWGYGIRWTSSGWLYNVAGRQVVRLELVHERPVMIGSDEPQALAAAIGERLAALPATGNGR